MNIKSFIASGILENYCLGFCIAEEIKQIESLSAKYPAIKNEIEKIRTQFEKQVYANAIEPSPAVKIAIMRSVYKQQAKVDRKYAPFIDENTSVNELEKWVAFNNIHSPLEDFEDLFISELPSTEILVNFIVSAKKGHSPEVHTDFTEYLFIIQGSCIMNFEGKEKAYVAGDIITIQPYITHSAIVTSPQPMLALVQRQKNI